MASKTPIDLTGQRFGRWTVIRLDGRMPYGGGAFVCRCDCGNEKKIGGSVLRRGMSQSCGCCTPRNGALNPSYRHGLYKHPLYKLWHLMRERCESPKHMYYDRYGGRGITICERWLDFQNFYEDNVKLWKPGLSIERKDNDGNYCPENCTWIPRGDQSKNRSNTIRLTWNGKTQPLTAWAKELNIPINVLYCRKRYGWPDDKALSTPMNLKRPRDSVTGRIAKSKEPWSP